MREMASPSVALPPLTRPWRGQAPLTLLLGVAGLLAGCGQKGPLTLPAATSATAGAANAASAPTPR